MIEAGFAENIIDLIRKMSSKYDKIKTFDKKIFENKSEYKNLP